MLVLASVAHYIASINDISCLIEAVNRPVGIFLYSVMKSIQYCYMIMEKNLKTFNN